MSKHVVETWGLGRVALTCVVVAVVKLATRRVQASELWYEQKLLDDKVRIKAGKIDANTEFADADNAAEFLNGGFQLQPDHRGLSDRPRPGHRTCGVRLSNGARLPRLRRLRPSATRWNRHRFPRAATLFGPPAALFMIGAAGVKSTTAVRLDGRLGLGGRGQTGTFRRFAGGEERGTDGAYLTGDQSLWRAHPEAIDDRRGIAAFLMLGEADAAVSRARFHLAGGVTWTRPVTFRAADVVGLGETWARLGDDTAVAPGRSNEWAIEGFYEAQVTPWLTCKPDLGFVRHPGGAAGVPDAVEGSVQFIASF